MDMDTIKDLFNKVNEGINTPLNGIFLPPFVVCLVVYLLYRYYDMDVSYEFIAGTYIISALFFMMFKKILKFVR